MFSFLSSFYYAIFGGFRIDETTTLSKEQQRKLLLSGVFSAQKGTFMNVVKTGMSYGGRQKMFGQGWGITDKESAIDTLDYLQHAGTRRFFPLVVEALKLQNKRAIQQYITENLEDEEDMRDCWEQVQFAFGSMDSLINAQLIKDQADFVRIGPDAWDAGRLVFMARLCREHEYITDEQMWQYIDAADEIAHQTLTSWEDLKGKRYQEVAYEVMKLLLSDYTKEDIMALVYKAFGTANDFTHIEFVAGNGKNEIIVWKGDKEVSRSSYIQDSAHAAHPAYRALSAFFHH